MKRIKQLDGIRAVAILSVFATHALHIKLLWMGVDLFFVLSGFLITGILLDAKHHSLSGFFAHFYSRRVRRIVVPYLLLLVVATIVFGAGWTRYWYFYILLTNFILPLNIPHPAAFEPLWSLAVEEQFYLLWPFAVYFLSVRRLAQLCIALIIAAPVLRGVLHFSHHWPMYTLTPFRMDLLAAGGLLSIVWRLRRPIIEKWGAQAGLTVAGMGLAGLVALTAIGVTTYANTRTGNVFIYESTLLLSLGMMIYALSGRGVGWLRNPAMVYIGQISYTMYLVHRGIIVLMSSWLHGVPMALAALTLTLVYASLSWYLIESRLLGRKRKSVPSQGGLSQAAPSPSLASLDEAQGS